MHTVRTVVECSHCGVGAIGVGAIADGPAKVTMCAATVVVECPCCGRAFEHAITTAPHVRKIRHGAEDIKMLATPSAGDEP